MLTRRGEKEKERHQSGEEGGILETNFLDVSESVAHGPEPGKRGLARAGDGVTLASDTSSGRTSKSLWKSSLK